MTIPFVSGPTWMTQLSPQLGPRALRQIAIPGAHDAGMSVLTMSSIGSDACNTVTQSGDILAQLNAGVRYFDFRPVTWSGLGGFYHGHLSYAELLGGYVGSIGQSLVDALSEVGAFVQQPGSEKEVIVFKLSHFLELAGPLQGQHVLQGGPCDYETFEQLASAVLGTIGDFLYRSPDGGISLNDATLGDLASGPGRVIVVFDLSGGSDSGFPPDLVDTSRGLFSYNDAGNGPAHLVVDDGYSDTDQLDTMVNGQLARFQAYTPGPGSSFLLSWTLTQQGLEVISGPCIATLAAEANPVLLSRVEAWVSDGIMTPSSLPNILYTDLIQDPAPAFQASVYLNTLGMTADAKAARPSASPAPVPVPAGRP